MRNELVQKVSIAAFLILATAGSVDAQSGADYLAEPDCLADKRKVPTSEQPCLKQLGDIASRAGDRLTLKLSNWKIKRYESDTQACEDGDAEKCIAYDLVGYFRAHQAYLISVSGWEGGVVHLVRRSDGSQTLLDAEPHFSPDGNIFAVIAANEAYGNNLVDIWRMPTDGPPVLEFRYEPSEYALYKFKAWDGNDRLFMEVTLWHNKDLVTVPVEAVQVQGSWKLLPPQLERASEYVPPARPPRSASPPSPSSLPSAWPLPSPSPSWPTPR